MHCGGGRERGRYPKGMRQRHGEIQDVRPHVGRCLLTSQLEASESEQLAHAQVSIPCPNSSEHLHGASLGESSAAVFQMLLVLLWPTSSSSQEATIPAEPTMRGA